MATPGQGIMAAPWYRVPPAQPLTARSLMGRQASDRPSRWLLGAVGAGAGLAVFLVLSDPTAQRTSSQMGRATTPARAVAAPPPPQVADDVPTVREAQSARFAAIDDALAAAAAGSRIAAERAHHEALRAFAAQQAARYDGLRASLRALTGQSGLVAPAAARHAAYPGFEQGPAQGRAHDLDQLLGHGLEHGLGPGAGQGARGGEEDIGALYAERLRALGEADGPAFDLLYVRHALALNRAIL
ncbi:MAG TPA: hypothetical protein VFX39_05120, partial [Gemmatimonadaceae bacterium]|nr:hypothetical protein [Gemmatimonadaceae bacterium]